MSDPKLETRIGTVELREDSGTDPAICGYAACFDVLSENLGGFREQIRPGAFDHVLTNDVRALFNHEPNLILGRTAAGTLTLATDGVGLSYRIDPPDTQFARDLMKSLKRGDVSQSSFAFTVDNDSWDEEDDGLMVRTIHSVKRLYDISPVTYPAYPDTDAAVRAMTDYQLNRSYQCLNTRLAARLYAINRLTCRRSTIGQTHDH